MLSPEEREQIVNSAKEDEKSALEEQTQHLDEAKAAADEAAGHDKEAKQAEVAMKNPPKDLSEGDKNSFIEDKKNVIQSAKAAAKESRDKEAEARKAADESKAKASAAHEHGLHPELPTNDDEKNQFKQQTTEALDCAKNDLQTTQQASDLL